MGSSKASFSENDLAELEWVYLSVCSALGTLDDADKALVRRRLFLLACNGMNDSELLKRHLIERFTRSRKRDAA